MPMVESLVAWPAMRPLCRSSARPDEVVGRRLQVTEREIRPSEVGKSGRLTVGPSGLPSQGLSRVERVNRILVTIPGKVQRAEAKMRRGLAT
jgi:hypothetical protein